MTPIRRVFSRSGSRVPTFAWYCLPIALFLVPSLLFGADEPQLALALKAKSDFDRVEGSVPAKLPDIGRCVQSQAALLPVVAPPEETVLHFRKGYCALAAATITRDAADYQTAGLEFERAIGTWPERSRRNAKTVASEPVPPALRILAQVAPLEANANSGIREGARRELFAAVTQGNCQSALMPAGLCQALLRTGSEWLGWLEFQRDELYTAKKELSKEPDSPWYHWVTGSEAFREAKYAAAASEYRAALLRWQQAEAEPPGYLPARLEPRPAMPEAEADLGGAQLLSGDFAGAVSSFSAAVRLDPARADAIYLRGRAKVELGQTEAGLADYNLASRTAFANAPDLAYGEAHFYRGLLLYNRRDFGAAEDEFTTALNLGIQGRWSSDAVAWRHMAAVAAGACASSRTYLAESLVHVTPYFPSAEARRLSASCLSTAGPAAAARGAN